MNERGSFMKRYGAMNGFFLLVLVILSSNLIAESTAYSLEQCIDFAWEHSTTMSRVNNSLESKQANLEQSKAALLPNLSASVNQSYSTDENYVDSTSGGYWDGSDNSNTNLALSSSLTLFNGLKLINTIRQSKVELSATEQETHFEQDLLSLDVLKAYINVLIAKERLTNSETQLKSSEEQVELSEARKEAGIISNSDYLNIKSQYASDRATMIAAMSTFRINTVSLMQTMNMPLRDTFEIIEPDLNTLLNNQIDVDSNLIYETALGVRPELKTAELNAESAQMEVKIAKADYLPSLTLNGSLESSYSDALDSVDFAEQMENQFKTSVGLRLSIPIFQNLKVKNQVTQASIQAKNTQLELIDLKNNLRKSVEQVCTDLETAYMNYQASLDQFNAEQEAYKLADEMFEQGMINSVDYQTAKNNYVNAENSLNQAKYSVLLQSRILSFYKGESITF